MLNINAVKWEYNGIINYSDYYNEFNFRKVINFFDEKNVDNEFSDSLYIEGDYISRAHPSATNQRIISNHLTCLVKR